MNEAETCRKLVRPGIESAGWDVSPHVLNEQVSFTDGRIVVAGSQGPRRPQKRADFLLRYTRDFTLAVVEAKHVERPAGDGMQQAKDYAEILGLKFAYATNGKEILEFDSFTGLEQFRPDFPTPAELWSRFQGRRIPEARNGRDPAFTVLPPRAARRRGTTRKPPSTGPSQAVLQGQPRVLLTMATGTGKTDRRLSNLLEALERSLEPRRVNTAAPRSSTWPTATFLVDDPKDKTFAPFGDAR